VSGATNEVGAPENRIVGSEEPVLTPQADDLDPVLGPVGHRSGIPYHLALEI
jgi:hypothetical protein